MAQVDDVASAGPPETRGPLFQGERRAQILKRVLERGLAFDPMLCVLPDGRLMFAYTRYCGTEGRDASPAEIAGRFNTDQGRTWSPDDTILLPNEGKANVMSVSLLSMGNGDLGLFYMRKDGPMACRSYLRRSRDGGQHWSDPVRVVQAPGYFVMNNDRVIRLGTGRIVVPVAFHRLNREPQNPLDFSAIDHRGIGATSTDCKKPSRRSSIMEIDENIAANSRISTSEPGK